jgi:hypothetical protein
MFLALNPCGMAILDMSPSRAGCPCHFARGTPGHDLTSWNPAKLQQAARAAAERNPTNRLMKGLAVSNDRARLPLGIRAIAAISAKKPERLVSISVRLACFRARSRICH